MQKWQRSRTKEVPFGVNVRRLGSATILRFSGELDHSHSDEAEEAIRAAEGHGGPIVVDLSEVTFLDSTALRTLLAAQSRERLDGGDRLSVIRSKHEAVTRVFEVTGTTEMFW